MSAASSLTNVAVTKLAVQRYDELLQQITLLKRENHELKQSLRDNEIKAGQLIEHYKSEIDAQTIFATGLKDELRVREEVELIKRSRHFRDQSTWIEEQELRSKENELISIIYMLEDEIQALKDDKIKQAIEFEREAVSNKENIKQSFMKDIDELRSRISCSVCDEVKAAIADTITDNHRLKSEFLLLLQEMERLQESRDEKDKELTRTRRELELLKQSDKLRIPQS